VTSLSSHVLDVERGRPATGVPIVLRHDGKIVSQQVTNAEGRVPRFTESDLGGGVYQLVFDVATYFRAQGQTALFFRQVTLDFTIDDAQPHYHVPLLLSAYACTSYRGS
jgi:5-hydroxyisourate hydrolase